MNETRNFSYYTFMFWDMYIYFGKINNYIHYTLHFTHIIWILESNSSLQPHPRSPIASPSPSRLTIEVNSTINAHLYVLFVYLCVFLSHCTKIIIYSFFSFYISFSLMFLWSVFLSLAQISGINQINHTNLSLINFIFILM